MWNPLSFCFVTPVVDLITAVTKTRSWPIRHMLFYRKMFVLWHMEGENPTYCFRGTWGWKFWNVHIVLTSQQRWFLWQLDQERKPEIWSLKHNVILSRFDVFIKYVAEKSIFWFSSLSGRWDWISWKFQSFLKICTTRELNRQKKPKTRSLKHFAHGEMWESAGKEESQCVGYYFRIKNFFSIGSFLNNEAFVVELLSLL